MSILRSLPLGSMLISSPPFNLIPLESLIALALIILVGIPICWAILRLISLAGTKYYTHFFKSTGHLTLKILGAQINLRVAGIVFLFLAVVIILALLYAILRMVPGRA